MRIRDFGITVETLLAFDSLAQAKVLAGRQGLSRLVTATRKVNGTGRTYPIARGELFLMVTPPEGGQNLAEMLLELNAGGAAGLGLADKCGPPPQSAVEAADRVDLPLFHLPQQIPAEVVINRVLTSVLDNQSQILDKIQDLNRALTSTMLHGGNLQEISKILYQRFGNSVAISSDFLSSYVVNTTADKRPALCDFLEEEKRKAYLGKQAVETEVTRAPSNLAGLDCDCVIVPIYSDNMLHGRIYMWEDFRPISGVEQSVLESATSLIALDMMKKMSVLHMENSNRGGFLADLLSGDRRQHQKALSNARYFDFEPKAGHQVLVIRLREAGRQSPAKDTLYQFNTNIIRLLQQAVRNTVVKIIYANQGNQIVLLLESTPSKAGGLARPVTAFVADLYRSFVRENVADLLMMGMGREYCDSTELFKSLAEAKRALACPLPTENGTTRFEDTGVYRILCHESIRPELDAFCDELLHPLLEYDRNRDTHLVETLAGYFECSGNLTRLSERLGIHYNTVSNRLQKIQDLTGQRLDDAGASLSLQVALKIHDMSRHEKAGRP